MLFILLLIEDTSVVFTIVQIPLADPEPILAAMEYNNES